MIPRKHARRRAVTNLLNGRTSREHGRANRRSRRPSSGVRAASPLSGRLSHGVHVVRPVVETKPAGRERMKARIDYTKVSPQILRPFDRVEPASRDLGSRAPSCSTSCGCARRRSTAARSVSTCTARRARGRREGAAALPARRVARASVTAIASVRRSLRPKR